MLPQMEEWVMRTPKGKDCDSVSMVPHMAGFGFY